MEHRSVKVIMLTGFLRLSRRLLLSHGVPPVDFTPVESWKGKINIKFIRNTKSNFKSKTINVAIFELQWCCEHKLYDIIVTSYPIWRYLSFWRSTVIWSDLMCFDPFRGQWKSSDTSLSLASGRYSASMGSELSPATERRSSYDIGIICGFLDYTLED